MFIIFQAKILGWGGQFEREEISPKKKRSRAVSLTVKDHQRPLEISWQSISQANGFDESSFLTFSYFLPLLFSPLFFLSLSSFYLYLYLSFPFYFEKSRFDLCRYLSASLFHSNPLALKIEFEFWFIDGFFFLNLSSRWLIWKMNSVEGIGGQMCS